MPSEWLCGMGIAGVVDVPGRSMISPAQGQAQTNMWPHKGLLTCFMTTVCITTYHQVVV